MNSRGQEQVSEQPHRGARLAGTEPGRARPSPQCKTPPTPGGRTPAPAPQPHTVSQLIQKQDKQGANTEGNLARFYRGRGCETSILVLFSFSRKAPQWALGLILTPMRDAGERLLSSPLPASAVNLPPA